MAKTEEEKAAIAEAKRLADEQDAATVKAESDRVETDRAAKAEEKRKAQEAAAGTKAQERTYTTAEVQAMLKQFAIDLKSKSEDSIDDEDAFKQKKVRLPRFQNKFIYGFKNTNTDEYFPELVVHAFDVWNEQTKRNDPWVTAIFEDDSTLSIPLYTLITKSQKVWVDLVEVIPKDASYSNGKTERSEVKDYSQNGTGTMVNMKVTMADYSYKVRFPSGNEVIVGKEVINW